MRRDDLEVGGLYLGSDGKCYQIIDKTPGWRIGFDGDWVSDASVRQRTVNGKKVPFRKNNALKAWLVAGEISQDRAVVTPNRLVRRWREDDTEITSAPATDHHIKATLSEMTKVVAARGFKPGKYQIIEGESHVMVPVDDIEILLASIREAE